MTASDTLPPSQIVEQIPKHGILVMSGFGLRLQVQRGHLNAEWGIGEERHHVRLPRVTRNLKRVIVIGSDGFATLEAIRWITDIGASLVFLDRRGKLLFAAGPTASTDSRLRRAQALAGQTAMALRISRELIDKKLAGQEGVVRHKLLATDTAETIRRYRSELAEAETTREILLIESQAASAYWSAWRSLSIKFPAKDEARIPSHWRVFAARISPLTGSPRLAVNPANAILNFLYALLESESRLAAATLGLDPGLGMLHVDAPARDSLACDLMEPARAQVDAFVLDRIQQDVFKREWFFEQRDGNCRLMNTLVERLSETAPMWRRAVAPFAEWTAEALWNSIRRPKNRSELTVPTRLTQRRKSEGRGKKFVLKVKIGPHFAKVCAGCGESTRSGRYCQTCAREVSREKLIELSELGRVATMSEEAQKKRSDTMARHEAEKKAWRCGLKQNWPDETMYENEIRPRLTTLTIASIASTLGVTEGYAADIRAGRRRPHPRYWQTLAQFAGIPAPSSTCNPQK